MNNETDKHFMSLALDLAEEGRGIASPNPMVGALVVRDGQIVGKGYHRKAGSDHAEVIALREAAENARGAAMYVTMEPCCHHGKTPPCTDAIIKSGITRVVSAMTDVNPLVCGGGFSSLQQNNIKTMVGILKNRAQKLNEAYMKFIQKKIPFVTLKLAVTLDGKIADPAGKSKWITGKEARKHVHLLRSRSDAVMAGVGTVLADDPMLTVRDVEGKSPLRVIVDSRLRTPPDARVFANDNVIIVSTEAADNERLAIFKQRGIEVLKLDTQDEHVPLKSMLRRLGQLDIISVLCEGGGILGTGLFKEKLIDKIVFVIAPKVLGGKGIAVGDIGINNLENAVGIKDFDVERKGDDIIYTGYPEYI